MKTKLKAGSCEDFIKAVSQLKLKSAVLIGNCSDMSRGCAAKIICLLCQGDLQSTVDRQSGWYGFWPLKELNL